MDRDPARRPGGHPRAVKLGRRNAAGTSWYVDPKEGSTGILMTQRVWEATGAQGVLLDFWTSAYAAIDD